jgi:hypothetical protein
LSSGETAEEKAESYKKKYGNRSGIVKKLLILNQVTFFPLLQCSYKELATVYILVRRLCGIWRSDTTCTLVDTHYTLCTLCCMKHQFGVCILSHVLCTMNLKSSRTKTDFHTMLYMHKCSLFTTAAVYTNTLRDIITHRIRSYTAYYTVYYTTYCILYTTMLLYELRASPVVTTECTVFTL